MAADLSTRISLRWGTDPRSEPTDTLVLNVGDYFMDLRVLKADNSIDWAMAGTKEIVSPEPLTCRWTKTLDSLGPAPPDTGSFIPLPNGDSLETGSMPCPHKSNAITPYEEVWRDVPSRPGPPGINPRAWIIQSVEGNQDSVTNAATTFLGMMGGTFLAFRQQMDYGEVGVRREEWDFSGGGGWRVKYAIGLGGGATVPSVAEAAFEEVEGAARWRVGEKVRFLGAEYVVCALQDV